LIRAKLGQDIASDIRRKNDDTTNSQSTTAPLKTKSLHGNAASEIPAGSATAVAHQRHLHTDRHLCDAVKQFLAAELGFFQLHRIQLLCAGTIIQHLFWRTHKPQPVLFSWPACSLPHHLPQDQRLLPLFFRIRC
jgi:hypothetical protein